MSTTEETWDETLLIPLPGVVPMRGHVEDSADCCGFIAPNRIEQSWRVVRQGSVQLNKDKMQTEATDLAPPPPIFIHLCESRAAERSSRSEAAKQHRRRCGTERRRKKKRGEGTNLRSVIIAATLAAPIGQGRCSLDPPWLSTLCSGDPRRSACRLFSRDHPKLEVPLYFHTPAFYLATMSSSSSSSHAQWQGATRWKQGWSEAWKRWDVSMDTAPSASEQISDERVTNALHIMRDHLQQTTVISQRCAQKMLCDAAHEEMEAATEAREQQEEARRVYEQKCQEATEAEPMFNGAIKDTLEKNKALEKHVMTVTMRAESCGRSPWRPQRQTSSRRSSTARKKHRGHFNELSAQRSQQNTTSRPTQ